MPRTTRRLIIACLLGTGQLASAEPCAQHEQNARPVLVELERPSFPNHRSRPEGDVQASLHDEELARWNLGGDGDPSYLSNRPRFHPGARVIADARVTGAWGRQGSMASLERRVQARVRSRGCWPFRICYEAALRRDQKLAVDYRARLTATGAGRVQAVSVVGALDDVELESCLNDEVLGLKLRELPAQRIDAQLRIRFWPGDVPVPAWDAQPDPSLDPPELTAGLIGADRLWQTVRSQLTRCAADGQRRDPKLWGRIAFWVEFGSSGEVAGLHQYESRFPDPDVTACVERIVSALQLPEKPGSPLVFALRVGTPPPPAGVSTPAAPPPVPTDTSALPRSAVPSRTAS